MGTNSQPDISGSLQVQEQAVVKMLETVLLSQTWELFMSSAENLNYPRTEQMALPCSLSQGCAVFV